MERRIGKTTRIIDRCIQELFTNKITYVYDSERTEETTFLIADRFNKRLDSEHPNTKRVSGFEVVDGIYCLKVER